MNQTPEIHLERVKARQLRFRSQGLCPQCGGQPKSGISPRTKKTYVLCSRCIDKAKIRDKKYKAREKQSKVIIDDPITLTGKRYRVINTGEVGQIEPCPCDDPIILSFEGGSRHVFFLRDVELTGKALTKPDLRRATRKGVEGIGRPYGASKATIQKMLSIHEYLLTQDKPVLRRFIQNELGFNVFRALAIQSSQSKAVSLESLEIVERSPGLRTWVAWKLTEKGRIAGKRIIEELLLND